IKNSYLQLGYQSKGSLWKYLPIPGFFILVMALSYALIQYSQIDVAALMAQEIARKGANKFLFESLAQFALGLAVLLFWVRWIHRQSFTSLISSRKCIDWNRVFFGFLVWGSMVLLGFLVSYWSHSENFVFTWKGESFWWLLVISLIMIPLQTSFEEVLFRGYMMQGLGRLFRNAWMPLVLTSVLFGLMHIGNPEVQKLGLLSLVYYITTGFFLGIITLIDEGLELAMGFHAANNIFTAILVTSTWTAFQTDALFVDVSEPSLGAEVWLPVVIFFPVVFWVFKFKYSWTNIWQKCISPVARPVE
ncbi:MAG: CPBP family intramembrane glutamic endopeptidase, partial [Flavobacteriaceae bacterium]